MSIIIWVNGTTEQRAGRVAVAARDDEDGGEDIARIVEAFETVLAGQRHVIARVWRDRSISKLNLHLLMLLDVHGPQSMGELASLAGVSLPNLTGIVSRMEELGLVRRLHSQEDRRKVIVRPAAKGRALLRQFESLRRAQVERIVRRLLPHERDVCLEAMEAMARATDELANNDE